MQTAEAETAVAAAIRDDRRQQMFKVNRQVFVDPEILALERARIFDRCWLYLCHGSELAAPGSFVTRSVGGRTLLAMRDRDGGLHAVYNTCPHRGAAVCREAAGSSRAFQCPYHGWTFNDRGELAGMPGRQALPDHANADGSLNLRPVERFEGFRDFLFVCFDPDAVPLTDYLAGAAGYLAYVADQGGAGMEAVGGAQDYAIAANWKLLQENSADGYHGSVTHSTYFDYLKARDRAEIKAMSSNAVGWVKDLGNGHAVGESIGEMAWGRPYARWVPGWGEAARAEVEEIGRGIYQRLGQDRGDVVTRGDRNLLIFPNLVVNDIMAVTVRTFYPVSADYMEVSSWALAPIGESRASRARRMRNFVEFLGPAGFATPDDVEMLEACQRGYGNLKGVAWNDISRGMGNPSPSKTDELQMRAFWRRWRQLMTNGPIAELAGP